MMKTNRRDIEEQLILFIFQKMLYPNKNDIEIGHLFTSQTINWERLKELMIYHEITPFAYKVFKNYLYLLPEGLEVDLKNNYYCSLVRNQYLWKEFLRILDACKNADVIVVPIKGLGLLIDIYNDKPIRLMTDIDILVKEMDFSRVERVFYSLGYKKELSGLEEDYWRKTQCHIAFSKEKPGNFSASVDIHWVLDFKRKGRDILPNLWRRLRNINIKGNLVDLLSPEDTLFCLALHQRRFGKTLCLKNAFDFALILDKFNNTFDWDYVLKEALTGNMCSTIFFLFAQARILLGQKIPAPWNNLYIPYWKRRLISQFIERNSFFLTKGTEAKKLYLKSHFLLYDSLWEPIEYILNIPREQFAKYYGLNAYEKKTDFLYQNRLLYILLRELFNLFHLSH